MQMFEEPQFGHPVIYRDILSGRNFLNTHQHRLPCIYSLPMRRNESADVSFRYFPI